MAGIEIKMEIEGMEEVQRKLERDSLLGSPIKKLLARAALLVERRAKQLAPVDTGRLRASITPEIDTSIVPLWAKVGTMVQYASFVEYGHKQQPGRYVPAIGKRLVKDFVEGKPFLHPAFEEMKGRIEELLSEARMKILTWWKS